MRPIRACWLSVVSTTEPLHVIHMKNVNHIGGEMKELQVKHMCLELYKGKPVSAGMPQLPTLSQM